MEHLQLHEFVKDFWQLLVGRLDLFGGVSMLLEVGTPVRAAAATARAAAHLRLETLVAKSSPVEW